MRVAAGLHPSASGRAGAGRPRAAARKSLTFDVHEVSRARTTPLHRCTLSG